MTTRLQLPFNSIIKFRNNKGEKTCRWQPLPIDSAHIFFSAIMVIWLLFWGMGVVLLFFAAMSVPGLGEKVVVLFSVALFALPWLGMACSLWNYLKRPRPGLLTLGRNFLVYRSGIYVPLDDKAFPGRPLPVKVKIAKNQITNVRLETEGQRPRLCVVHGPGLLEIQESFSVAELRWLEGLLHDWMDNES